MTAGMRSQLLKPFYSESAVEQTRTAPSHGRMAAWPHDHMTTGVNVSHARCWGSNKNTQRRTRHVPDDDGSLCANDG